MFHLFEFICCVYCGILIISGPLIAKVWRTLRVPLFLVLSGKNLLKLVINMAQSSTRCTKAFLTLAIFLLRTPVALRGNKDVAKFLSNWYPGQLLYEFCSRFMIKFTYHVLVFFFLKLAIMFYIDFCEQ